MNPFDKYLGPEDRLHMACTGYLKMQYPNTVWHHSPNEGKRSAYERYKFKALGGISGFPDLVIFRVAHGYSGLAIEFKIGKNKPTENQIYWINKLKQAGWLTEVIYDFDKFKILVDDYLK